MKNVFLLIGINLFFTFSSTAQRNPDAILGKWITTDNKLIVEVYRQSTNYKAKIIWFKDVNNKAMNEKLDEKNPDKALRNRKWLGMEVLRNLRYDAGNNDWEEGIIYDAKHGREWDSIAWINNDHLLKVKGYWIFKFISETLIFKKI